MMFPTHRKDDVSKTERQWNLLGYALIEGAEGVKMWASQAAHGKPFVYYDETQVVKDNKPLQLILARKKAKAEFYREKMKALKEWHTRAEWLELGRIVELTEAECFSGYELNDLYFIPHTFPPVKGIGFSEHISERVAVYSENSDKICGYIEKYLKYSVDCLYYHFDDTRLLKDDTEKEQEHEQILMLRSREDERFSRDCDRLRKGEK